MKFKDLMENEEKYKTKSPKDSYKKAAENLETIQQSIGNVFFSLGAVFLDSKTRNDFFKKSQAYIKEVKKIQNIMFDTIDEL